MHGSDLAQTQPTKLAAMESHWETSNNAPIYLFTLPDERNRRNIIEIGRLPSLLSILSYHNPAAEVKGLNDFPKDEIPQVLISHYSFRIMVGLGFYFVLLTIIGWIRRNRLLDSQFYLKLMLYSIPLPYLACELGWTLAEVGRQPWIVYGLMKTSDAVSPIATSQVFVTLIGFVLVYSLLGAIAVFLMMKNAKKSPELL